MFFNLKRWLLFTGLIVLAAPGIFFAWYWISTQPIQVLGADAISDVEDIPVRNKQILQFIEAKGKTLAPNYEQVVCTEFVIKVIEEFTSLTASEENKIRIITSEDIGSLLARQAPVIKGVHTSLIQANKGVNVQPDDVKPGDFVQFWNSYFGKPYGHCGVVLDIDPYKTISIYSSHPVTGGYGKQKYWWPRQVYFVRLQ